LDAESEERLAPFKGEAPKRFEKERFQAISDYFRQLNFRFFTNLINYIFYNYIS